MKFNPYEPPHESEFRERHRKVAQDGLSSSSEFRLIVATIIGLVIGFVVGQIVFPPPPFGMGGDVSELSIFAAIIGAVIAYNVEKHRLKKFLKRHRNEHLTRNEQYLPQASDQRRSIAWRLGRFVRNTLLLCNLVER